MSGARKSVRAPARTPHPFVMLGGRTGPFYTGRNNGSLRKIGCAYGAAAAPFQNMRWRAVSCYECRAHKKHLPSICLTVFLNSDMLAADIPSVLGPAVLQCHVTVGPR